METLFEGVLDRCIISGSEAKKEWKKGYCVFRKHTKNGSKMLEFYKDSHWNRSEPKAVCNLFSDYTVHASVSQHKKRFTFELKTVEQNYELGTQTQMLRQKWMDELVKEAPVPFVAPVLEQKFNIIKSFNVVLLNEEHIKRFLNSFNGSCQLVVTDAEIVLMVDGNHKVLWKFAMIRRYKSQTGVFIIEVGRKAPTGEGEFRFETSNPVELFDVLEKAVKDRMKAKGIEVGVSTPELPPVPKALFCPPPLPSTPTPGLPPMSYLPATQVPIAENEYSHLGDVQPQSPVKTQSSDYDMLFNRERLIQQRVSEPNILNGRPQPLPSLNAYNSHQLTPSNSIDNTNSLEDQYEEMTGTVEKKEKHEKDLASVLQKLGNNTAFTGAAATTTNATANHNPTPDRKPRPLPAPRLRPSVKIPSPKMDLRKTNSSPLVETTYETPSSPAVALKKDNSVAVNKPQTPTDYDTLFNSPTNNNNNVNAVESEYSHLDHNGEDTRKQQPNNTTEDLYNVPKSLPKPPPIATTRKTIAKPNRPAPLPPTSKNTAKKNGRLPGLSSSAGATNDLIVQLQKRNEGLKAQFSEDLYDRPVAPPIGYNQVGELIPGEYHRVNALNNTNSMDSDGYVKVPESDHGEDIYQVPRE